MEQQTPKRKRGRPRKHPLPEEQQKSTAVLDPPSKPGDPGEPSEGVYSTPYRGRKYWILGVKVDKERNQLPCHGHIAGGIAWQQGTQRQIFDDGYLALDSHRTRATRILLYYPQVEKAIEQIRNTIVRWRGSRSKVTVNGVVTDVTRYAAEVLNLNSRLKTIDPKTRQVVPAGFRHTPEPKTDIPLSTYLVLMPKVLLTGISSNSSGYEPDIDKMPSMLELDPSLVPARLSESEIWEFDGEDETW